MTRPPSSEEDLSEEDQQFLYGRCHLFTLALHRLTGLPLAAYLDNDPDIDGTALVHAFVLHGEHAIDVRGKVALATILDDFETWESWLDEEISAQELIQLGEGEATLDEGPEYERAVAAARRVMTDLNLPRVEVAEDVTASSSGQSPGSGD